MPPLDLETLVPTYTGASNDRKIVDGQNTTTEELEVHPDWPPESFWLSGDAEFDWWDRNAVYSRSESTKGNSIVTNPNSNSNSQRFSKNLKKSKATIIGLPKPQKTAFADVKNRRNNRPGNARLFPKRSVSVGGRSETALIEPSSPKVSCIGRVRSRRDRNRRLRTRQRSISSSTTGVSGAIVRQKSSRNQRKKTGFFESVRSIFRSSGKGKPAKKSDLSTGDSSLKKRRSHGRKTREGSTVNRVDTSFEESFNSEPPGLGSLNRFASGRRSGPLGVGEIH